MSVTNSHPQRLTPSMLKTFDDIATDILVDIVYYWTKIRKNHDTYTPYSNISSEEIIAILRPTFRHLDHKEGLSKAVSNITSLPCLQIFCKTLNPDEQKNFQQHLRKYIEIYMPDCPFEVSSTNRYTIKLHEAAVVARQPIKKGVAIKYLCGTRVRLTREEEAAETAQSNGDFSIVVQDRNNANSLFLGPARFLNHECKNANAKLQPLGRAGMEVIAISDIQVGEDITVSYGDYYFDADECHCKTCNERLNVSASTVDELLCRTCGRQFSGNATLECPNCRRHLKIYGHQWPQRRGNPGIDPKPQVAVKKNQAILRACATAQEEGERNSSRDYNVIDEDYYFPTLDELTHSTLCRRDSFIQRSNSSIIVQSDFLDLGHSYERPILIDDR